MLRHVLQYEFRGIFEIIIVKTMSCTSEYFETSRRICHYRSMGIGNRHYAVIVTMQNQHIFFIIAYNSIRIEPVQMLEIGTPDIQPPEIAGFWNICEGWEKDGHIFREAYCQKQYER